MAETGEYAINMPLLNAANVFVLPFCDAIKGKKPSLWYG
jgi:hypothetical protein